VRPEVAEQIESMGAEFVYLDFEETSQDSAATGGYAAPSSPEFREKQLEKFRELAPEVDIVITTALIPNRPAPKLWTEDMVAAMKPGSVIVDLAAEKGGNCELTRPDEKIRHRQRRDHRRLHRFPQPHGDAILDALRQQHPPHDDRPDARARTARSSTTWRMT
jgi:NAD/NADP transhydrogenase alpha subunit